MIEEEKKDDESKERLAKERKAKGLIHACVGPSLKTTVRLASSAHQAWNSMEGDLRTFANATSAATRRDAVNLARLHRDFVNKSMTRGVSMAAHIDTMKKLAACC